MACSGDFVRGHAVVGGAEFCLAVPVRQPGLEARGNCLSRLAVASGRTVGHWHIHLNVYTQPDYFWSSDLWRAPAFLGFCVGGRIRVFDLGESAGLPVGSRSFRIFRQGIAFSERCRLLYRWDFPGTLSVIVVAGVPALE